MYFKILIIGLHFFFLYLYACNIFIKSNINSYVIIQMFKFQIFEV